MTNETNFTEDKAEATPAGGVLIGKREGQTIIHDKGTLGGYLVGQLHKQNGIKAVNKSTGQPLEMQGGEIVITAPAVSDNTKREFDGRMMTNREILSKINSEGGGVSFAEGGDIPVKINVSDKKHFFKGKKMDDVAIAQHLGYNSSLKNGGQLFSYQDHSYDIDKAYKLLKSNKLAFTVKTVKPFAMKYPIFDKKYVAPTDFDYSEPFGIMVKDSHGKDVLIDGNHRMNEAYKLKLPAVKVYYITAPNAIEKFSTKISFELGGNTSKLLASNGKPSNLTATQYNLVRTPEFKAWFGDWEKSPEQASKVIDENGEPLVVYHGTNGDFPDFNENIERKGVSRHGFFFTPNLIQAESYTIKGFSNPNTIRSGKGYENQANIIPVFLSLKKPLFVDANNTHFRAIGAEEYKYKKDFVVNVKDLKIQHIDWDNLWHIRDSKQGGSHFKFTSESEAKKKLAELKKEIKSFPATVEFTSSTKGKHLNEFISEVNETDYDGAIFKNINDMGSSVSEAYNVSEIGETIWVKNPNQIKSSIGNNGKFSINTNDIRFADGGILSENEEIYKKWQSLVNMTKSELKKFYNSPEGKKAGLSASEAKAKGIDSGRESARWIMKMKDIPVAQWTEDMWKWAKKQINFINRMSGNKGGLYDSKSNKTRKHTSLLIWGHNPEKNVLEEGGHLSKGKSLEDIAQMHDVSVEHINNQIKMGLKVESEHTSDKKEQLKIAKDHLVENPDYYTILEKVGLEDGGYLQNKSKWVKVFYQTNSPAIDYVLQQTQPLIEELIEKQKALYLKHFERPMSIGEIEMYEANLIFNMVQAMNKYFKQSDIITNFKLTKQIGKFEISATVLRDSRNYDFSTELIPAGGYNIQEFHYRYITKTDLPNSFENTAVENLKAKLTTIKKIKTIDDNILIINSSIKRYDDILSQGFEMMNKREYPLDSARKKLYESRIKEQFKEIEKLNIKKSDIESVLESLSKSVVGANFGKKVKEAIGRKFLDRLHSKQYKETGNTLTFKTETQSITEPIENDRVKILAEFNTISVIKADNDKVNLEIGFDFRKKYTIVSEFESISINEIASKINEVLKGKYDRYLEDGGNIDNLNQNSLNEIDILTIGNLLVDNDGMDYHEKIYKILKLDDKQFEIEVFENYKNKGSWILPIKNLNDFKQANQEEQDFYNSIKEKQDNSEYKNGGEMKKENLEKDAKDGNTPARDLNNYNDLVDVQEDGVVGNHVDFPSDSGAGNDTSVLLNSDASGIAMSFKDGGELENSDWMLTKDEYLDKMKKEDSYPLKDSLWERNQIGLYKNEIRKALQRKTGANRSTQQERSDFENAILSNKINLDKAVAIIESNGFEVPKEIQSFFDKKNDVDKIISVANQTIDDFENNMAQRAEKEAIVAKIIEDKYNEVFDARYVDMYNNEGWRGEAKQLWNLSLQALRNYNFESLTIDAEHELRNPKTIIDFKITLQHALDHEFSASDIKMLQYLFFNEVVVKDLENKLSGYYEALEILPASMRSYQQHEMNEYALFEQLQNNPYYYLPADLKKEVHIKRLDFSPVPDSENLGKITDMFVDKDKLRPILSGVNFDVENETIEATNGNIVLVIKEKPHIKTSGTFLLGKTKDWFEKNIKKIDSEENYFEIEGKFPLVSYVIPNDNEIVKTVDAQKILNYLNSTKYFIDPTTHLCAVGFLEENDNLARYTYNANHLISCVKAMLLLGHKELDFCFNFSEQKPLLIVPKGNSRKVSQRAINSDLCLLMTNENEWFLSKRPIYDLDNQQASTPENMLPKQEVIEEIIPETDEIIPPSIIIASEEENQAEIQAQEKDALKIQEESEIHDAIETLQLLSEISTDAEKQEIEEGIEILQMLLNTSQYFAGGQMPTMDTVYENGAILKFGNTTIETPLDSVK